MPPAAADVVLVHGLGGSGADHWQRWLLAELTGGGGAALLPELSDPDTPSLDVWTAELAGALGTGAAPGRIVLAHSLGCWAWVHAVASGAVAPADRLLLVSPPSPAWLMANLAEDLSAFPAGSWAELASVAARSETTVLIGGGDPYLPAKGREGLLAAAGGLVREIAGGAHLNTDAGYGPWPAVLGWVLGDDVALLEQSAPAA